MLIVIFLSIIFIVAAASVSQVHSEMKMAKQNDSGPPIPEFGLLGFEEPSDNFGFALAWNYGESGFYDSDDGTLITEKDDNIGLGYSVDLLYLDENSRNKIKSLIENLAKSQNLSSLFITPRKLRDLQSIPSQSACEALILTVRRGEDSETLIFCRSDSHGNKDFELEDTDFCADICRSIVNIITQNRSVVPRKQALLSAHIA